MKPSLVVLPIIFGLMASTLQTTTAQTQTIGLNSYYGANPNDKFSYQNEDLGNYSLGWYQTANAAEFRASGFDGVKLFTNRIPRLSILKNGNVGIGTDLPDEKLTLNGNFKMSGNMYTPFTWRVIEHLYDRPIISTGWFSGLGDFISLMHGGNNTDAATYGLRVSDGKGFEFGKDNFSTSFFVIDRSGKVGIGTNTPDSKLAVNGRIHAKEVKVDLNGWSDFVFYDDYKLLTLEEVEKHIDEKGHLPEMPNEEEVLQNGISLGEMDAKLLQKIEELTLYTIQQEKKLKSQDSKIEKLEEKNEQLTLLNEKLLQMQSRLEKLESEK